MTKLGSKGSGDFNMLAAGSVTGDDRVGQLHSEWNSHHGKGC